MNRIVLTLILLAGLTLGLGCHQPVDTVAVQTPAGPEADDAPPGLVRLAKTDHVALLTNGLERYHIVPIRGYTCTFTKQERMHGIVQQPQTVNCRFRTEPFSVGMIWTKNPPLGDRLLYVEGTYQDDDGASRMLVRPKGAFAQMLVGKSVLRSPTSPQARQSSLRPITLFGFENNLKSLIEIYELAEQRGELKQAYKGTARLDGRTCLVLERTLTKRRSDYPAQTTTIYLDIDSLMPMRIRSVGFDGNFDSDYVYRDVKFNPGLTDKDFTPQALGIAPPDKD